MFTFHIIVKIRINRHTRAKTLYKLIYRGIFYPRLSSFSRTSEVLRPPHFASSLVVFKSPALKIDFVDFLQIQAAFTKTNYTTFSFLLISMCGQGMSEIQFLTVAAGCSIFTDIHSYKREICIRKLKLVSLIPRGLLMGRSGG